MKGKLVAALVSLLLVALAAFCPASQASEMIEVSFPSEGVTLAGTIIMPDAVRPSAGIVIIHGSGPAERLTGLAQLLSAGRFAVLTYDKRGVGKSGGVYVNNALATNLRLLAKDAQAAMKALSEDPRLADIPLGYFGLSQGGWIAPIAARENPRAKFMAFLSGPVTTVGEEDHFSKIAEGNPDFWKTHTDAEVLEMMKSAQRLSDDYDPLPDLAAFTGPALWLLGGQDVSIPVGLSTTNLDAFIRSGKPYFQYRVFPEEGHNFKAPIPALAFVTQWIELSVRR
jgi:pimeloyl-ACP methyl ester carboxylesterase